MYGRDWAGQTASMCAFLGAILTSEVFLLAWKVFGVNCTDVTAVRHIVNLTEKNYGPADRRFFGAAHLRRGLIGTHSLPDRCNQ